MLKGVSHRIIEVNHPDSLYFERAVFYLRPEADDLPVHAALCETERYFAPGNVRRQLRLRSAVWFFLGAAVTGILWLVLHFAAS